MPRENRQIAVRKGRLWLAVLGVAVLWAGAGSAVGAEEPGSTATAESPAAAQRDTATEVDILAPARAALADGQPQRALKLADGARQAGADQVKVLLLKAEIFAQMQQVDNQRNMLLAAVAVDNSLCLPWLTLANIEQRRGLWQQAEQYYKQAIAADSSCCAAYLQLARLYERYNQPTRALRTLQQAAESNPQDITLLQALGAAFKQRGMLQSAESVYGRILAQGDKQQQALAHGSLGDIYQQVGQYKEAFDCYVRAEKLLGDSGAIAQDGYDRIFTAADGTVAEALNNGWQLFDAFIEGGPVAREDAYLVLEGSLGRIEQIQRFIEQVQLSEVHQELHSQRKLFYAVAHEALVTAQVYLDTGDTSLLDAAQQRRAQANQEQGAIPGAGAGGD